MAQTKRRRKHRGNAAGMVEARGRTSRPREGDAKAPSRGARAARGARPVKPPSWQAAINRAGMATAIFVLLAALLLHQGFGRALAIGGFMFVLYVPMGYWFDGVVYRRRQATPTKKA